VSYGIGGRFLSRTAYLLNLPQTPYHEAYALQTTANAARHHGRLDRDLIIMLEHSPVFTLGRRGGRENILVPEALLEARGIQIVPVERGGNVTFHGPGQLVVYLIVDLLAARYSVADFVSGLEAAMVRTAACWEITAAGNEALRGAWVDRRKLGSVGLTVRRGVTFHGLALNVSTDLEPFSWINPCGIQGCSMTSLVQETGRAVDMARVRRQMADELGRQFGLSWQELDYPAARGILEGA
jgi:lipoyl(octanoyl) transferase